MEIEILNIIIIIII